MPVKISKDVEVSLNDLVKRKNEGYLVEATPHVGNLGVRNLAAASLGFTVKLVDTTKGKKDDLFHPHCIIINGQKREIASSEILTTHNKVNGSDVSVTDFHTKEISKLYSSIISQADWMKSNSEMVKAVYEIVTKFTNGKIWERYVGQDGIVHLGHYNSPKLPENIHRVTTSYDAEGWITANPVNLLCDMISGVFGSGRDHVYLISDSSMYRYIHQKYRTFGKMDEFISQLYDVVRMDSRFYLPEHLNVSMVPLSCLTHFTAPSSLANELDRKLSYLERLTQNNKRAGQKERQKLISGSLISRMSFKRAAAFKALNKPLELVSADPTTGALYTQHDLLERKDTIYIPQNIMEQPLSVLWTLTQRIERLMQYKNRTKKSVAASA